MGAACIEGLVFNVRGPRKRWVATHDVDDTVGALARESERCVVPMKAGNAERGKAPHFWVPTDGADGRGLAVGLTAPESVGKLQKGLYDKAKSEPALRFYSLYDKVYRPDILRHAWEHCRANGGAPGVDGVRIEHVAANEERFLAELGKELREKTYVPSPVRRVLIPKAGGGERPLGIPTVRDRVAQTAVKLILEPIFEADFLAEAYGYRPGRQALAAVKATHRALCDGYSEVVDADLSKYFDTIPHAGLMKSVARRVSDGALLHLIKLWLEVPTEERDDEGHQRMRSSDGCGTPQGGVISPLLANIYMHRFLRAWHQYQGPRHFGARLINYADDFVILCRRRPAAEAALDFTRRVMTAIGLTLNEAKTRLCNARTDRFKFLGYELGVDHRRDNGRFYLSAAPSKVAVKRAKEGITELFRRAGASEEAALVGRLNRRLQGWRGYFSHGTTGRAYTAINRHVYQRILGFLQRRHKVHSRGTGHYPWNHVFGKMGVVLL